MPPPPTLVKHSLVPSPLYIPRVFALPEVFRLICDWLHRHDQARLLAVSRHFFTFVVPIVWRAVRGPEVLLKLLPNIDITRVHDTVWIEVDVLLTATCTY